MSVTCVGIKGRKDRKGCHSCDRESGGGSEEGKGRIVTKIQKEQAIDCVLGLLLRRSPYFSRPNSSLLSPEETLAASALPGSARAWRLSHHGSWDYLRSPPLAKSSTFLDLKFPVVQHEAGYGHNS